MVNVSDGDARPEKGVLQLVERAGELGSTTKTVEDGSETSEGIGVRMGCGGALTTSLTTFVCSLCAPLRAQANGPDVGRLSIP